MCQPIIRILKSPMTVPIAIRILPVVVTISADVGVTRAITASKMVIHKSAVRAGNQVSVRRFLAHTIKAVTITAKASRKTVPPLRVRKINPAVGTQRAARFKATSKTNTMIPQLTICPLKANFGVSQVPIARATISNPYWTASNGACNGTAGKKAVGNTMPMVNSKNGKPKSAVNHQGRGHNVVSNVSTASSGSPPKN